jgi:hypothetical protein
MSTYSNVSFDDTDSTYSSGSEQMQAEEQVKHIRADWQVKRQHLEALVQS